MNMLADIEAQRNQIRLEIEKAIANGRRIVLIYQMGKVGSTSYEKALRRNSSLLVFRLHRMNKQSNERMIDSYLRDGNFKPLLKEESWRAIHDFTIGKGFDVHIITGIRDPIARNISAFFENVSKDSLERRTTSELFSRFVEFYPHDLPIRWFETELREVTKIDIFNCRFNKSEGWGETTFGNRSCLILAAESPDEVKAQRIRKFLSIKPFRIGRENMGLSKFYGHRYREFLDFASFDERFLDNLYKSHAVKHFYEPSKIGLFRNRWVKNVPD